MNRRIKQLTAGVVAVLGVGAIVTVAALAIGGVAATPAPSPTQAAVNYERPADNVDISTTSPSSERALAEQAAAEAAAQAEAARIAAEQAAAQAEADRQAAEQAQADSQNDDRGGQSGGADPWSGKMLVPWIADPNPENTMGGYWDTSQCPTQSGSTGPDGRQYCD